MTRYTPKMSGDPEPGTAHLFRQVCSHPGREATFYRAQVWKPSFEDGELLREAGWKLDDEGNEDLENTMLWYTVDPEAAFAIATPERWHETDIHELTYDGVEKIGE